MSVSRTVYLRRNKMLTPKAWADAVRAAGFPMEMDTDFDVATFSGFLPCRYDGGDAGFEYSFDQAVGATDIGDRDIAVSFVTHSSLRELASAVVAAAVLCAQSDGILLDEESGEQVYAKDALADARAMIEAIGELD